MYIILLRAAEASSFDFEYQTLWRTSPWLQDTNSNALPAAWPPTLTSFSLGTVWQP